MSSLKGKLSKGVGSIEITRDPKEGIPLDTLEPKGIITSC